MASIPIYGTIQKHITGYMESEKKNARPQRHPAIWNFTFGKLFWNDEQDGKVSVGK